MHYYKELETLCDNWKGKVCLFGAGLIGRTWGYDIVDCAGFSVDFYCDNKLEAGTIIRNDIRTIMPSELYDYKENVLIFLTVSAKYQEVIIEQLQRNGMSQIVVIDFEFQQKLIESILEADDKEALERYKILLDDKEYLKRQFEYHLGHPLDLDKPVSFNEKLQWLKLNDRNTDYIKMVDKYEAKKCIADKIGEEYIIPTLGVYETFDEIKFEALPEQFVLKCTHDSGSVVICRDQDTFDKKAARYILEKGLERNFYWACREWPYKDIKPRIIAEEYIVDESNKELKDYKIFNFNGKAKLIQVDFDRFESHKRNLYTTDWEYIKATIQYPTDPNRIISRPKKLEKMLELAEKISANIPHVRTDFYSIGDKIYFGEMTFYHGAGYEIFTPKELDYKLGELIDLP